MKTLILGILLFAQLVFANSKHLSTRQLAPGPQFYRDLTLKIRNQAAFMVPFPGMQSAINYSFQFGQPVYREPLMNDMKMGSENSYFFRSFWDRILFNDDSYLLINGEKLPLTCVFVIGQDNRFLDKNSSPLLPEIILKIYLVANDYSCQGPIKPGWPETGGQKENWDTYLHYEIRDPTIMLPVEAKLRYRWNEYNVVLVDRGNP